MMNLFFRKTLFCFFPYIYMCVCVCVCVCMCVCVYIYIERERQTGELDFTGRTFNKWSKENIGICGLVLSILNLKKDSDILSYKIHFL